MALYKSHSITLDTKRTPKIALQNIVVGETGNKLTVTLKNDGSNVALNGNDYRVCLRVDSAKGIVRQDSSLPNSGISFSSGKAIIMLSRDSFAASVNRCRLEIFSTETDTDDILICSSEFQFTAASNDTGENAGEVYPSLIIAENEARQATENANAAAQELNSLLDNIDAVPTTGSTNLVTSGGVKAAIESQSSGGYQLHGFRVTVGSQRDVTVVLVERPADIYAMIRADSTKAFTMSFVIEGVDEIETYLLKEIYRSVQFDDHDEATYKLYFSSCQTNEQLQATQEAKFADLIVEFDTADPLVYEEAAVGIGVIYTEQDFPVQTVPSDSLPLMNGVASAGISYMFARWDHVHPSDTSKQNVLTFDSTPTLNSLNPVTSGGVAAALADIESRLPSRAAGNTFGGAS